MKVVFAVAVASSSCLLAHAHSSSNARRLGGTPHFKTSGASSAGPVDFKMKSRVFVPYGNGDGYAFGMGAAEKSAYDDLEKYSYSVSEQGYVNVVDWSDSSKPTVQKSLAIDLEGFKLTDVNICPGKKLLFVGHGAKDTVSNGRVRVYSTAQRGTTVKATTFLREIETGPLPDMISPNNDCTMLAAACEAEGAVIDGELIDPEGSVTLVRKFDTDTPEVMHVKFGSRLGTDEELIAKGVHLPLPLKAMVYWDEHSSIADKLNFTKARASYSPAMNLEPEYLGWSYDSSKVYVNLQESNAIVTVTVPSGAWASQSDFTLRIDALGLKDWSSAGPTQGIDLIKDNTCALKHFPGFSTLRQADTIQVVNIDNVDYILAACEGDDKEYGDYAEKFKFSKLVKADNTATQKGMTVSVEVQLDATSQRDLGADPSRTVTVGSATIDYSNPAAPEIKAIVGFGGRGISIFKDAGDKLELTWDSNSELEMKVCEYFPWAHNSIQDEEFAPVNGGLYNSSDDDLKEVLRDMNDPAKDGCADAGDGKPGACPLNMTIDSRSPKDGPAPESMAAGEACGRLLLVTATEKSGVAFVYDITTVTKPKLLFVKHLTPISKTKSAGVAYATRELGDIDTEGVIFVDAAHSPSGSAGVFFGGAWSGTMSFWEFECSATTKAAGPVASSSTSNVVCKTFRVMLAGMLFLA
mmetsp:Transcript_54241/g.176223  ORF Transcript_54241/g.176223 Transcript_54241/m.176223 type:complete len:693 (+) Transcript_54241:51-2129(+)